MFVRGIGAYSITSVSLGARGQTLAALPIERIEVIRALGLEFRKSHYKARNRRCFGAQNCVPQRC